MDDQSINVHKLEYDEETFLTFGKESAENQAQVPHKPQCSSFGTTDRETNDPEKNDEPS